MKTITEEGAAAGSATGSARWALASLSLAMLMPSLATSIANVGLPTLARTFDASFQEVQWIVLAYLLAVTTLIVVVGRVGDLIGRRRLLLLGISVFTAASLLCGVAPTLSLLIAARAAQGLGAAVMMTLSVAMVGETVPKERTGAALGLLGAMSAVGTTVGPSLGGVLIAGLGWRTIFLANVPLGLLGLLLARRALPVDRPRSPVQAASFRWATLREPGLRASLAMSGLVTTVMMTTLVVGPFYLSRSLGLDEAHVGLGMSAGPLVAALTGVPAGRLVDRLGASRVTVVGLLATAAGCLLLSAIPPTLGLAGYLAPIVVATAGYALFQAANNTAVMADVRKDERGVVSGLLTLSRQLGLIGGASVMGAVFAFAAATADVTLAPPEDVARGLRVTFAVATALILVALALALTRRGSTAR